ncbi:MAG: hypothetical protein ACE5LB_03765 [Acidiferrobacterales bacterium]
MNKDFAKSWRYRIGLTLIVFGHLVLLLGLLAPVLGLSAGIAGGLFAVGEVTSLTSIVFLGKEGFLQIKRRIVGVAKAAFVAPVGVVRHYIGIFLLCLNGLVAYTVGALAWKISVSDDPLQRIWGLDWREQSELVLYLIIVGEIAFVVGIYVLGARWWERFRHLLVWQPENR